MTALRRATLALLLAAAATAGAAEAPSRLETLMGSARFREAGLDRQTPEQLRKLEQWMFEHAGDLSALAPASEARSATAVVERKPARSEPATSAAVPSDVVVSRIAGPFQGWNASTTLELENGQRWRISDGSALVVAKPIDRPEVTLKRGLLGGWLIHVTGFNTQARVKAAN